MKKITFDVPKKMIQAAQQPGAQEEPYNVCLHCPFMGETCDGADPLSMSNERWVKWINSLANMFHITRQQIADRALLPLSTVNSVLSGRTKDVRHSTMQAITRAVVGDCWGKYPCHIAYLLLTGHQLEDESDSIIELNHLRERIAELKEEKKAALEDAHEKVEFLRQQINLRDRQISHQEEQLDKQAVSLRRCGWVIAALAAAVAALLILHF